MKPFSITTDSNSDLPQEYIMRYNTTIIPQYYSFGDVVYGDELNMCPSEFYERMKSGALPLSQANNPIIIEDRFRTILERGEDIIHIGFSSALSGSYKNVCDVASKLKEEYPNAKIEVIDTLSVSLGETILYLYAEKQKAENVSYDEIIKSIKECRHHINVQFTVDDLFHLQRGGRVSKATAILGTTLSLKPFLYVNSEGGLTADGTTTGRKKSIIKLVDRMVKTLGDNPDYSFPVGIVHGNCYEDACTLEKLIKERTAFTNVIINDISPSIGTHAGPGALGILYYGDLKAPAKARK